MPVLGTQVGATILSEAQTTKSWLTPLSHEERAVLHLQTLPLEQKVNTQMAPKELLS